MKQIITLFILLFVGVSSSFAVTSTVALADASATSLSVDADNGTVLTKAKVWVQKTVKKANAIFDDNDRLIMILLAIFIPPIGVYLYEGQTWTNRVTLNLILTILGFGILGMIHALYLILGEK